MKKWIWVLGLLIITAITYFLINGSFNNQQTQINIDELETYEVRIDTLTASIGATGKVRVNQSAILTWDISGEVEQVNVSAGEPVVDGQILAVLEETSLSQNVILAQAELVNAQQELDNLLN